jgi:transcription elongation factor GreA
MDYITADDKARLKSELDACVSKRKVITSRIEEARALGDLKENAEYHAAREDQGMNEARIRELEQRLSTAIVADASDAPDDMVFLGATVKLRDVKSDNESFYRLVGKSSGEFDDDIIEVTPNSPMGQALFKARIGETIRVDLRRGTKRFEIVEFV